MAVNPIYNISKRIKDLKPEHFAEIEEISNRQLSFTHPLKHAKQANINNLGRSNLEIVKKLKEIQEIIKYMKPPQP